jgi:putative membrane protein
MMWWYPYSGGGLWFLPMLVFWVLLVVGVVFLLRWLGAHERSEGSRALDILKERYARGEVSKAEFEEKRRDLTT